MTRQTQDILVAYTKAIAREAALADRVRNMQTLSELEAARRAVRESRARLIDAIERLEAKV